MPDHVLVKLWGDLSHQHTCDAESIAHTAKMIHAAADHFQVTSLALFWRLVRLHIVDSGLATEIIPALEKLSSVQDQAAYRKAPFSRFFLKNLAYAIDNGRISVRKAASILRLDVDGFADTFRFHGLPVPFDI
jgi:XRE family transcriptional regulator, fatty acid utilization regulator